MSNSVFNIINICTIISGVLPVLAAWYNYKNLDKTLKIVAAFLLVSSLFDWVLEIAELMKVLNNLPAIHIFIITSIVFYCVIYYYTFFNPLLKNAIIVLSSVALIGVIVNMIFFEGIWEYPSNSNTILSVMMIVFSLTYFYQLLNRQEFMHIEKIGLFWINAGVLLYFAINIFLFMLLKRIIQMHQQQEYYLIHIITNIIANLLYTGGLLCKPQKTTTSYQY